MRKIVFLFFFTLFTVASLKAQETLPIYQQYLLDGDFLINPALYGNTDKIALNLNYQKQFSNFGESPNVQSIGLHANVVDRLSAGLSFFRDQNGPISANGITVGAAYFIPIDDDGERKNQFSFGTNLNFYNMNIDYGMLNPEDPGDPLLDNENGIFLLYNNLGMAATYRNFFVGASVLDIPLNKSEAIQNGIEPQPTKILLNLGYDYYIGEDFFVTPSVLMNLNTNSARTLDLNLMATAKSYENSFSGGVSFRNGKNAFGNQSLSLSPIIKATVSDFFFGATYNFGMSDIKEYAGSSFMISIGYNFDNFINSRGFRYR